MIDKAMEFFPPGEFVCDQLVRSTLNQDVVDRIAQSFLSVGQLQPVRARRIAGRLKITDGNHRVAAALQAPLELVTCIVEGEELTDGDAILEALVANCNRAGMMPLDAALATEKLIELSGWSAHETARKLGFSDTKVSYLRKLLTLPAPIIEQIKSGAITASGATELARIDDAEKQAELAEQLAAGRLTRDGLAGARKQSKRASTAGQHRCKRAKATLGDSRSVTVSAPALTLELFIAVLEELLGKARRERSRGTELVTFLRILRDQAVA